MILGDVTRWVSKRVMSRTKVNGKPVKRETKIMVRGGPSERSLWQVWTRVWRRKNEKVNILAKWHWPTPWRPESVTFLLQSGAVDDHASDDEIQVSAGRRPTLDQQIMKTRLGSLTELARQALPFATLVEPGRAKRVKAILSVIQSGGNDWYLDKEGVKSYLDAGKQEANDAKKRNADKRKRASKVRDYAKRLRHSKWFRDLGLIKAIEGLALKPTDPLDGPTDQQKSAWKKTVKTHLEKLDDQVWDAINFLNNAQKSGGASYNKRGDDVRDWWKGEEAGSFYKAYPQLK